MHFLEYVNNKETDLIKFCEDRKKGATKITAEAKTKGGASQLTAWHFAAKLPEYDECIKAIKAGKNATYFQQQELKLIHQLAGIRNQKRFQEVMGKAEVWGEVFLKVYGA